MPRAAFLDFRQSCAVAAHACSVIVLTGPHARQMAAVVGALASRFKISLGGLGGRKAALERQALDAVLRLDGGMPMIFVPRASIGFSSRI